jgi:hypothetical protein
VNWLRWAIDVHVGHRLVMQNWVPDTIQAWWYFHICNPAGLWECRDL